MKTVRKASAKPRPGGANTELFVRLSRGDADYLARMVPQQRERPEYLRRLLARDRAQREREALSEMFAVAAKDVSDEDRAERRALAGAFASRE